MQRESVKRYVTIVATFSLALGIGFVMQNGDVLASRLGVSTAPSTDGAADPAAYTPVRASGFVQPQVSIDDAGTITTESSGVITSPDTAIPDMTMPGADEEAAAGCEIQFEATPQASAMVALQLKAPCAPETLVTVQHQGMRFNAFTDTTGVLSLVVPALAKEAFFIATLEQGQGIAAMTGVPDISNYDRAVLQWRGNADVDLHAFEFGAADGQDGHIWRARAGSPNQSEGYMTELGAKQSSAPLMVQVYTYPSGMSQQDGTVALQVEALVTETNCGRQINAQSIQVRPENPPAARNITLRLPECDQIGEFLVLKNMFEDLTLAAR